MDFDAIRDEIFEYNFAFFNEYGVILQENNDFLEKNNLIKPQENYLVLFEYLKHHVSYFKNLDSKVFDNTFLKLYSDVLELYEIYMELKNIDIAKKAHQYILEDSLLLKHFKSEIKYYQEQMSGLPIEQETLQKSVNNFKKLQNIIMQEFKEMFFQERFEYITLLAGYLNTKLFYLDAMMWHNIKNNSPIIVKRLDLPHLESKYFIESRLKIILPLSVEYSYLERCLKVFK